MSFGFPISPPSPPMPPAPAEKADVLLARYQDATREAHRIASLDWKTEADVARLKELKQDIPKLLAAWQRARQAEERQKGAAP